MKKDFEGKVAIVTGGAYGIGRATALAFAKRGAKVVLVDVDEKRGKETERLIKEEGGEGLFLKSDVSKEEEVKNFIETAVKIYGKIDCAFNNAGIHGEFLPFSDFSEERWNEILNINLKGVWLCMKHEIREMEKKGGGVIVNTSSVAGIKGVPSNPAYPASKHGVVGLTKAAAIEFAKKHIRINCICPGPIRTGMYETLYSSSPEIVERMIEKVPMGRLGEPEEVASVVLFLCSEEASYITGAILPVDGGIAAE